MPSQRKSSGGDPDVKSEVQEWPAEVQNQRCLGCGSLEEHDMLLCDGTGCSAGWHLQCLNPPLKEIPEGDWFCPCCRVQSGGVPEPPRQAAPPPLEKHLGGTSGQGGSKARRASGAVGGTGEVPIGIDPESLEEENNQDHCVCDLCGFLMV
ncbi:hypothetical protein T484DRAFT_1797762 [Baffinella frigidus]|nr:hypothetical protein T484DRAFT_1797762 [Cryptophyta sp. CCMP2293]